MSLNGIRTIKNILIVFCLIGMLTAVWRMSGTISLFIYFCSKLIVPSVFVLIAFLVNCAISVLTGTALGTAATVGVICMSIGNVIGINEIVMGGAILSGAYFGDRCSPMSTCALLVCEVTKTNIYDNIKGMIRSCVVPFCVTCIVYLLLGLSVGRGVSPSLELLELFPEYYSLHWTTFLPAALIIILSAFKVNVKWTILASTVIGIVICIVVQEQGMKDVLFSMVMGYQAPSPELAAMMNGGGIISMARTILILCISCTYAGIFEGTGFLAGYQDKVNMLSTRLSSFGCVLVTSMVTGMIACNQTLSVILTQQLCKDIVPDKKEMALALADSAAVIPPLIPWSIASTVPITAITAPVSCIFAASFLYLLPLWRFVQTMWLKKDKSALSPLQ